MSDSKSRKLVLMLSHNSNNDKSTVAFTIASAALSTGPVVPRFVASRDDSRDYGPEETVEGNIVTGAGPMLEWVSNGAATLCL